MEQTLDIFSKLEFFGATRQKILATAGGSGLGRKWVEGLRPTTAHNQTAPVHSRKHVQKINASPKSL